MVTADKLSEVISKIYQAPLSSGGWIPALKAVEELTNSTYAPLQILPTDGRKSRCLIGIDAPEAGIQEWFRDYLPRCKRIAHALAQPVGMLRYDYLIMDEEEMARDPVYRYYETLDYRYFLGMKLHHDARNVVLFSLQRRKSLGHAQKADIELFNLLVPHVRQALQFAATFETLTTKAQVTADQLNTSLKAVIFISHSGDLLFANDRAQDVLSARDGLLLANGQLRTSSREQQLLLDSILRSAFSDTDNHAKMWFQLKRPGGSRPHLLNASRLHAPADDSLFGHERVIAITISLQDGVPSVCESARSAFALTERQSRVAAAICAGHSLESCAHNLGISKNTARVHLNAVFRKSGVSRQQDLCRLLLQLQ